jgi:hypothetical protein
MEVGEEVVRALGAGFDLTSDFRLRFAKAAARRLVELDEEEARRDLPEPGRVGSPAPPGLSRPGNFGGWSEGVAACRGGNYACRSRVVRSSLSNSSARREGAQVRFLLPHFARFAPPPPNALGIASSGRKRWRMSSVLAPARLMPTAHLFSWRRCCLRLMPPLAVINSAQRS